MEEEILTFVLADLGITTEDEEVIRNIKGKIRAVKQYLINGGLQIKEDSKEEGFACISIGVNDLLNNKSGDTKFSPAFKMLAMQICRG